MIVLVDQGINAAGALLADGSVALTADWDAGPHEIRFETVYLDVADGTPPATVVSTTKVDNLNADRVDDKHVNDAATDSLSLWTADRIIDYATQEIELKPSVKAASTADLTLSGEQTIDGVACVTGDRVLVRAQSTAIENGIYVVDAYSWTRAADMAAGSTASASFCCVQQGTTLAESWWVCTADDGNDTVGSDSLAWARFDGTGSSTLAGLSDTTIDSPADLHILGYSATSLDWENMTPAQLNLATVTHTHSAADITSGLLAHERGGLETDISAVAKGDLIVGTATGTVAILAASGASTGDVAAVQGDGTLAFQAQTGGSSQLNDLSDVTITSPANNSLFTFDTGSNSWIDQTASQAGVAVDTRLISTTEGLQGGGNLTADRTLKLDVNGLTADGSPDTAADYIATWDADAGVHKKVRLSNLPGGGDVSGPASSTDDAVVCFDGTGGKTVQNSAVTIDDNGKMKIKAAYSNLVTASDGPTVTFNLNDGNVQQLTLGGNRTLALSNVSAGQRFMLRLVQDGSGSRTVTWFSTIKWAGGGAPTLTTTASKADVFGFLCTSAGHYDGFVVGQNI